MVPSVWKTRTPGHRRRAGPDFQLVSRIESAQVRLHKLNSRPERLLAKGLSLACPHAHYIGSSDSLFTLPGTTTMRIFRQIFTVARAVGGMKSHGTVCFLHATEPSVSSLARMQQLSALSFYQDTGLSVALTRRILASFFFIGRRPPAHDELSTAVELKTQ